MRRAISLGSALPKALSVGSTVAATVIVRTIPNVAAKLPYDGEKPNANSAAGKPIARKPIPTTHKTGIPNGIRTRAAALKGDPAPQDRSRAASPGARGALWLRVRSRSIVVSYVPLVSWWGALAFDWAEARRTASQDGWPLNLEVAILGAGATLRPIVQPAQVSWCGLDLISEEATPR